MNGSGISSSLLSCTQLISFFFLWVLVMGGDSNMASAGLSTSFYEGSCNADVAAIVTRSMQESSERSNVVPPAVLRLFFHDAMVQGCDASILISSTEENVAERDSEENESLRQEGFDAVANAKQAVDSVCPSIVSCADILALAARDAVVFSGGPTWEVQLGRLDGLSSNIEAVSGRLPGAHFDVPQLIASFVSVGLSATDLVLLSGAHTIGFSHCRQFTDRLYNFEGVPGQRDPSLDASLASSLEAKCPPHTTIDDIVGMDATSPFTFDTNYYKGLVSNRGLLFSDQTLATHPITAHAINQLATSSPDLFFQNFVNSMINLGNVISDSPGNVRRVCNAFN